MELELLIQFLPYTLLAILVIMGIVIWYGYWNIFLKDKPKNTDFKITDDIW
jgi:hypothetical protein